MEQGMNMRPWHQFISLVRSTLHDKSMLEQSLAEIHINIGREVFNGKLYYLNPRIARPHASTLDPSIPLALAVFPYVPIPRSTSRIVLCLALRGGSCRQEPNVEPGLFV